MTDIADDTAVFLNSFQQAVEWAIRTGWPRRRSDFRLALGFAQAAKDMGQHEWADPEAVRQATIFALLGALSMRHTDGSAAHRGVLCLALMLRKGAFRR